MVYQGIFFFIYLVFFSTWRMFFMICLCSHLHIFPVREFILRWIVPSPSRFLWMLLTSRMNLTSTRCSVLWRLDAWCKRFTSVPAWLLKKTFNIMVWLLQFTLILRHQSEGLFVILSLVTVLVHFIMIYFSKLLVTFHRRYSDIMVHRLLAVAIGALDSYPDLLSKVKTQVGGCPT